MVEKDGELFSLNAGVGGCEWEEGCSYVYRLSFTLDVWDSTFTYHVRMSHRAGSFLNGEENLHIPAMYFSEETRKIRVDWGDGTSGEWTSSPGHALKHVVPDGWEGDVVVSVAGASPYIIMQGSYVQGIAGIEIEGSDLYDSRDGCNCIIETETGELVYAGIDFTFHPCIVSLGSYSLATIECEELVIPEGVESLGRSAVCGYNYYTRSVRIPSTLVGICDAAFDGSMLDEATVDPGNPVYDSRAGCKCIMETGTDYLVLATADMALPPETRGVRPYACQRYPSGFIFPSCCTDYCSESFTSNNLMQSADFPAGSTIGQSAFYSSRLETVGFSGAGTVIGKLAFRNCTRLEEVSVPSGCTVGERAFGGCYSITKATLGCELSGRRVFENCSSLRTLELLDGFSAAWADDFYGCPLGSITVRCAEPPVCGGFNLGESGTLHIPSGDGWDAWARETGFTDAGWTILKDL